MVIRTHGHPGGSRGPEVIPWQSSPGFRPSPEWRGRL